VLGAHGLIAQKFVPLQSVSEAGVEGYFGRGQIAQELPLFETALGFLILSSGLYGRGQIVSFLHPVMPFIVAMGFNTGLYSALMLC